MTTAARPDYRFDPDLIAASKALRGLAAIQGRWVAWSYVWRNDKWDKPPCRPNGASAASTRPKTWSDFDACASAAKANGKLAGVGFVLADDGVIGLDFDHCLDEHGNILEEEVDDLIWRLGTYTEISPSGTGLRCLLRGTLPELRAGKRGFTTRIGETKVEVYASKRYVTLTGNRYRDTPDEITDCQPIVDWLLEQHLRGGRADGRAAPEAGADLGADLPPPATEHEVEVLLENFPELREVWEKTCAPPDDDSQSAWDLRLAAMMAWRGFTPRSIAAYLRAWLVGLDHRKQARPDYYARTIDKAFEEIDAPDEDPPLDDDIPLEARPGGEKQTAGDASGKNRGTFKAKEPPKAKAPQDWPDPGVIGEPPPAPPFPTELLPKHLRRWVERQAENMGLPACVIAIPALVMVAGTIGKDAVLRVKANDPSWTERPCLWGALVMPKGTLKSPAIKLAVAPLRQAEAKQRKAWKVVHDMWKARQAERKKAAKDLKMSAPDDPEPIEPKLVVADATIEALAEIMMDSHGLTLVRDELSGWILNMSRYNKGSDRQFFLECHSGGPYAVDRIQRGRQIVPDVYLSIVGGIQPRVARLAFAVSERGTDDGFLERFGLICYPDQIPWAGVKDTSPEHGLHQYIAEAVDRLANKEWWRELGHDGLMHFDGKAQARFLDWYDAHMKVRVLASGSADKPEHGFATKAQGLVCRLAITLHLFNWTCGSGAEPAWIGLEPLERAIGILERFCLPMYERVAAAFGTIRAYEGAKRVAGLIQLKKLDHVRIADITKLHWQGMREREPVVAALDALEDRDWLRREIGGGGGGRPTNRWKVNPRVHD